ncbi:hypothetical protein [Salinirubrum litoreum]|uniref:Caspase domain-containing protein n=1 Tax=Salinirubrum litoreum TaxID=1126234 RepID=A0ABD5RAQ5_9EURY
MTISFERLDGGPGVTVVDSVERRQFSVETPSDVSPSSVPTDEFYFPVDEAVRLDTDRLRVPTVVGTYVRGADGEMLAEIDFCSEIELPAGRYTIELCPPIKCYLRVEGTLSVTAGADGIEIETGSERIDFGARSRHERPEATVTVTEDPRDVMAALSTFGSALKTTSVERSYPTLRGHPPAIEVGEELSIPETLDSPDTGVTIEVPPNLRYVYPVASLAYYLGASVEPGPTPRLVTDHGFTHALSGTYGFEETVARTLKQLFLLDCCTRTEGYYTVDLHERRAIAEAVDLDFAALYDAPLAEQIEAYLDVPYGVVAEQVPEWKLTTHVAPTPDNAELLPFLVTDLAVIRLPSERSTAESTAQLEALSAFTRDGFTRSASEESLGSPPLVQPEQTDSIEQSWAGENAPFGASKSSIQAFQNRLDREPSGGDIDITVVCNDAAMDEEGDLAEQVYGSRDNLPFDVQTYRNLSVDALRAVIETDGDFLHYIGHIDEAGFQCADGRLDAREIETVGVDAFMLNACRSYEQGMALLDGGAVGGVVTLAEVINSGAVRVGRTMVRLLNQGFPLRAALTIAKGESIVGGQYIVVGDGNVDVVQPEGGLPILVRIDGDGPEYDVEITSFPNGDKGIGSLIQPSLRSEAQHYLGLGTQGPFTVTRSELRETLSLEELPIKLDGRLTWSSEVDL